MKLIEKLKSLWRCIGPVEMKVTEWEGSVQRVVFEDGDVFVVTTDQRFSNEQRDYVEKYLRHRLKGADVLLLDGWIKLDVISMHKGAEVGHGTN